MTSTKIITDKHKQTVYKVTVKKDKDFSLDSILDWIKHDCHGRRYYRKYKTQVVFSFYNKDDAFKFKLRWELA